MKRIDKLIEGIKPVIPNITENDIVEHMVGECENCVLTGYCDQYFYYKKDGEYVLDEDGEQMLNPDMGCEDIVTKWLHEDFEESR